MTCIFGDWSFRWDDVPKSAYRPDDITPLIWRDGGVIEPVRLSEDFMSTATGVALVAHWTEAHQSLLESIVGQPTELDSYPRMKHLP